MDRFYLGLDIGGTNIRIAFYNETANILGEVAKLPFQKNTTAEKEIETNILDPIRREIKNNGLNPEGLKGVGLSLAALFDRKTGDITCWPNNQLWNGFPLKKYLSQNLDFKVPVVMEDDANAAAVGESLAGAGRGYDNLAYITVSTGIGCGLILNGHLFTGANGWAGEIGHIKIVENGPFCKCGRNGCLQSLASGPALLKRSNELATNAMFLNNLTDLRDVVCLAHKGEDWALKVFEEAGGYLANMIIFLIMTLDLSMIVIGGGVSQAGEVILNPIRQGIASYFSDSPERVIVKTSQLGDNSGVIGALNLIRQHLNGNSIQDS